MTITIEDFPTAADATAACTESPADAIGLGLYVGRDPLRGRIVVSAVGRADERTRPRLFGVLKHLLEHEPREWVELDVADLLIATGEGLAKIATYQRQFAAAGGLLTLAGASGRERLLFQCAGVHLSGRDGSWLTAALPQPALTSQDQPG